MKSSTHSESSSSHSSKRSSQSNRGRKQQSYNSRQDQPQRKNYDNNNINYFSQHYQPSGDKGSGGAQPPKKARLNPNEKKESNKKKPDNTRPTNNQRATTYVPPPRPPYNPLYQGLRPPYAPGGSEMFYQTGRLPTGMYVPNRNVNVDNLHAEESSSSDANTNDTFGTKTALIPKSHFLLKSMPSKGKSHVAVPFLQCNATEKTSTKEPSTSKKAASKASTSAEATSSEESTKADNEKPNNEEPSPEETEEIERQFQTFTKIKQETSADDSDAQPPSIGNREFGASLHQSPPSTFNQSIDFTSDSLPFNYQFSPAYTELHCPDPSIDKNAIIAEINNSVAELKNKKANLMRHSKNLTSQLHRVLTEVEVIDIQIEEKMYKAAALRNG